MTSDGTIDQRGVRRAPNCGRCCRKQRTTFRLKLTRYVGPTIAAVELRSTIPLPGPERQQPFRRFRLQCAIHFIEFHDDSDIAKSKSRTLLPERKPALEAFERPTDQLLAGQCRPIFSQIPAGHCSWLLGRSAALRRQRGESIRGDARLCFQGRGTPERPPLLSIFGGKTTTYRKLAEHALQRLKPWFPTMSGDCTAARPLPGGDIVGTFADFVAELQRHYAGLPQSEVRHCARQYGARGNVSARPIHAQILGASSAGTSMSAGQSSSAIRNGRRKRASFTIGTKHAQHLT